MRYGKTISSEALKALQKAEMTEGGIKFDFTMNREVYEEVNEIFRRMRGKWKTTGKKNEDGTPIGQFTFEYFKPSDFLPHLIATGEMPPDNPTDFYPTPKAVVKKMIEWAELKPVCEYPDEEEEYEENTFSSWFVRDDETLRILEPHGGVGGVADQIRKVCPDFQLDVIELLPINANILRGKGYNVIEQDFLKWLPPYKYNAILMNPPYDGTSYIDHVMHGYSLLKEPTETPNGNLENFAILVAILPTSWQYRTDLKSANFRKLVTEYGWWEGLPSGTFKDSGTNIETCIVALTTDKRENTDKAYRWHIDVVFKNNFIHGLYSDYTKEFERMQCDSKPRLSDYERIHKRMMDTAQQMVRYHQGYKPRNDNYRNHIDVTTHLDKDSSGTTYFRPKPHVLWDVVNEWIEEGFVDYLDRHDKECDRQPFLDGLKMYNELYKIRMELDEKQKSQRA